MSNNNRWGAYRLLVLALLAVLCSTQALAAAGDEIDGTQELEKKSLAKGIFENQQRAFATENERGDNFSGFVQSLLVMLSLEFGDRTFFIASLMSSKHDSKHVFFGAILALWLMTFVSVVIGIEAASMSALFFIYRRTKPRKERFWQTIAGKKKTHTRT